MKYMPYIMIAVLVLCVLWLSAVLIAVEDCAINPNLHDQGEIIQ